MATKKYLDNTGLAHFWGKIKSWVTGRGYITSSGSITGNAGTATKLKTARAISAGDLEFQGSASFDGSGDVKLNVTNHRCIVSVSDANNYPFHRIAYVPLYTGNYNDRGITFLVNKDFHGGGWGICRIIFRTNNAANGQTADCNVQWLVRSKEISADSIQVGFVKTAGASYLDVFYKSSGTYNSAICRVLACSNTRNGVGRGFTVVSASTEVSRTTATDPKTSAESYKTIADAGTALHGQAYTDIIAASDAGVAGKLANARTLSLTGDVSGSASFDGSANASITATVADDSHNHVISNVDGLQTALDAKAADSGVVHLAGAETITGAKTFSSEVSISTANALRMKSSSYGAFFRNDNSSFYLLVTASGDADGTWTTARPLTVDLATGVCSINGAAATATGDADGNAIKTTYAKLASPALTGAPTAPTAAAGTNTTQIATTAFVNTKCGNYVAKSGDTMTGDLAVRARDVDLSTTSTSRRETWPYRIDRNTVDTTHNGSLMRLGAVQPANTKDYSLQIAVANPRGGNLPTSATISAGTDDSDASTGNCWGGIGVWYDYSKNRVYPVTQGTSAYAVTDNNSTHLATTNWVRTATGDFACNAATATKLAGPKHSYTVAKGAAKNWYRLANANTSQTDASKTLHAQFIVTAYNTGQDTGYYERWFVDCEVFGRNAGIRIFGTASAPFSQARVLYENTIADIDANDRPAIDLYLNYVMNNAATTVAVEEVYNSGWTFVADGALAASSVPSGFENVASGVRNNGVERSTYADYVSYLNLQRSNITAAFTLADNSTYRSRTLNCTGTFTITVPSIDSGYMWCVIKNKNATSGVITIHPSTTSVLIDGSNADITLQPGEYVCIHSAGANNYSLIADGRWKSHVSTGGALYSEGFKVLTSVEFDLSEGTRFVAHRGLCSSYPENTALAFQAAGLSGGFYGIETDIQWTSDGYAVCIHDGTVNRTTSGTGNVKDKTLAQIRALDAGSFVNSAYSQCNVPTFEEYLNVCLETNCVPFIEIKTAATVTQARLQALVDKVVSVGLQRKAVFLAFSWDYLPMLRTCSADIGLCGLSNSAYTSTQLTTLRGLGGRVLWGPTYSIVTAANVSALRAANIGVYAWTVDGTSLKQMKVYACSFAAMNNLYK